MGVVQAREVTLFKRQPRIAVIMPDFAAWDFIQPIYPRRGFSMQFTKHGAETLGCRLVERRVRDEMIVVGEHGPRFERPTEFAANAEQASTQHDQSFPAAKMMLAQVSTSRDEVSALFAQAM